MVEARVSRDKWIGPVIGAAFAFYLQTAADQSLAHALMISLATLLHLTAMTLRDAEFRAISTGTTLNRKDVFAYGCALIFDAVLMFGLISGAGDLLEFGRFAALALIICAVLPFITLYAVWDDYDPSNAAQRISFRHWSAPLYLGLGALLIWNAQAVQLASGDQPYVWLMLGSAVLLNSGKNVHFEGAAKSARIAVFSGTMILLIWNYLNIS